ncbi:carbonic anhydrase family protein [Polynucleobacter sp. MWH-UH23A]|uniref:carbonic anhydrase n=1 Tax=Polynucleobacter sp. MWH-UH23A TaxID=1855613 RepID=UPI003364B811
MKTNNLSPRLIVSVGALLSMLLAGNALASDSHDAPAPAAAAPAAPKTKASVPAASGDDQMSKALFDKISKGSGDIVIRTGDLPAGAPPSEVKAADKPKVAKTTKPAEKDAHDVHWSYIDGPGGPENWGNLSKANLACSTGKTQSPININVDRAVKAELPPLEFLYRPSPLSIVDNGHTVMVNYGEGSNLLVDGRQYRLVQFHFHKPSEEAINGERTDMVVHLVHQHHDGSLAVVGVLMNTKKPGSAKKSWFGDDGGKDNPMIQTLWNNVPLVKGRTETPGVMIDVNQLLPTDRGYFTYMGSLTTPPCSENVLWFVMKNPIYVSEEQVKNFDRIYPMNARPLQPKGDRLIKETRGSL